MHTGQCDEGIVPVMVPSSQMTLACDKVIRDKELFYMRHLELKLRSTMYFILYK